MPVLSRAGLRIDYSDEGHGRPVVLIHSSVSGNRQWRALTGELRDRYRLLAVNLFGYGQTSPWPGDAPQSLAHQAELIRHVCETVEGPVGIVGHSFGGCVALKSALLLGDRVSSLALLEPNPFHLLKQAGSSDGWRETLALHAQVTGRMARGDWEGAAAPFADYWLGEGAWEAMPERRRAAFIEGLPPNFHEWDAALNEPTPSTGYAAIRARTLVLSDRSTRASIREIVALLREACPGWTFRFLDEGGHMAPLIRPDLVNPIVAEFLDAG
jgi:pimeloyl-ACP methyl ester carboxylesterase